MMKASESSKGLTRQLSLDAAFATDAGIKPLNEDYAGLQLPDDPHQLLHKGAALALADGLSCAEAGQEASRLAVTRFLQDYFQTPDSWTVQRACEKCLSSVNQVLFKRSQAFAQQHRGYLTTFCAAVIKSRTVHVSHAGDSRVYLLRQGELEQLTRDHVAQVGKNQTLLARALGMDNQVVIDYTSRALEAGDCLLLTSDGVHGFLPEPQLISLLQSDAPAEQVAQRLIEQALAAGSNDNLSCVITRILSLPAEDLDDFHARQNRLPFPPPLSPGMKLDGYEVEQELFASSRSQIYLVRDSESGQRLVMKTPSLNFQDDAGYIDRFEQEEWIGRRLDSPYLVRMISQSRPRSARYYLMEYVEGISLDKWMKQNRFPNPRQAIELIRQLAAGLEALHSRQTIHQDLKPANIIVGPDNRIKIVDYGSVHVAGIDELARPLVHEGALGTATYSDPHYLQGKNSGVQGDIYALATITYELFTGELPYGERIESCRTMMDYDRLRYHSARLINPVLPVWFDRTLERGVSLDLAVRYTSLGDFLLDLQEPNPEYLKPEADQSVGQRPMLFWLLLSGAWIVMLLVVLFLFKQGG